MRREIVKAIPKQELQEAFPQFQARKKPAYHEYYQISSFQEY
jgi:hypothetical protein